MGGWGKGKNRGNKGGKAGKGKQTWQQQAEENEEQPGYLKAVNPVWALNKAALRAYASNAGSPFYAAQNQLDADFLSVNNIMHKMEPYSSEIANRLGIALSEAGGTIGMGSSLLQKYTAEPKETGEKLGIQGAAGLFETDAGKAFAEAADAFNKHSTSAAKNTAALQAAATKWVNFLLDDPEAKAETIQRWVKSSARSYLAGMELLQWLAAASNLPQWAEKLKANKALQPKAVQKWTEKPSDRNRLMAALVAAYEAQVEIIQPKKAAEALSDGETKPVAPGKAAESSSSSQTGSSSTSDKKAKKKKKDKKSSKKDKKKNKKKDKKEDKKSKKKKSKKSSSSGSGSGSTKKKEGSGSESASASTRRKRKAEDVDQKDKQKEKKAKKEKKEKPRTVKVYRVTGATADGKMVVKKTDAHDEVDIDGEAMTVADVQLKLLTTLGYEEDFDNWSCRLLEEDGQISTVAPGFPAKDLVGDLVLVKKGG